ncbi:hypothetical protein [Dickeya oryzae]|uniref:Uncharacterized protein n=1 Tax=Dickeya oryzae TaxID=1240404 RepID=A0AB39IZS1_9GAMM|nr:hypothetical protein [Dickeya oryzae]MCA6991324.1 hypothetical protein [Dickeya oryzae]MCA6993457.1 hypothetical protein [Dickeya oryzae]
MPRHHASRGILVLESPWELDALDANRSSVVPFIEGIAKVAGDTEVYCANFYDKASFRTALQCLCKIPFKNIIIYVAAHGQGKRVGGTHIRDVLVPIGELSHQFNITGLLLGACFVGAHTELIETFTRGNQLRWCAGYACETEWLTGTLIDCAIINQMLSVKKNAFSYRDTIIDNLALAISPFHDKYAIGRDEQGRAMQLRDAFQCVVQPDGQGHKPRTVSNRIFERAAQLRREETA